MGYPGSRLVASWFFQQLVRVLFRLDVRDTQVGLKVFRREIADQVVPLLLVKRYAFDIELLAVARAFGFGRVRSSRFRSSTSSPAPAYGRQPCWSRSPTRLRSSTGYACFGRTSANVRWSAHSVGRGRWDFDPT